MTSSTLTAGLAAAVALGSLSTAFAEEYSHEVAADAQTPWTLNQAPTEGFVLSDSQRWSTSASLQQSDSRVRYTELPPPPVVLKIIPPRNSMIFGFEFGYGYYGNFTEQPDYVNFGFRLGWGRHIEGHRLGVSGRISLDGAILLEWMNNVAVTFDWDWVKKDGGILVGASVGPEFVAHATREITGYEWTFGAAPRIAARVGYSQPYNINARRFFVAVEPAFRWAENAPDITIAVVLGSGWSGR